MRVTNLALTSLALIPMMLPFGARSELETPAAAPPGVESPPDPASARAAEIIAGTIVETMDAGGYTYVLVDTGARKVWAAGPKTAVAVGEKVEFPSGMAMRDFHSNTLDRTFEVLFFVRSFKGVGSADAAGHGSKMPAAAAGRAPKIPAAAAGHGAPARKVGPAPSVDLSGIQKASGGHTVAELFAGKAELDGVKTAVRGRVVKFNSGIMGRNWLHIRDGSGSEGTDDLTVTTADTAQVGDLVVVRGTLKTNQDFGHGYSYDLLVENATVEVE